MGAQNCQTPDFSVRRKAARPQRLAVVTQPYRMQALPIIAIPVDLWWNILLIFEDRIPYLTNLGLKVGKTSQQDRHPPRTCPVKPAQSIDEQPKTNGSLCPWPTVTPTVFLLRRTESTPALPLNPACRILGP